MTPGVAILRPAPANQATAARVCAHGLKPKLLPLFAVRPIPWTPPDPAGFDALLLTSANSVRCAGAGLRALAGLPVVAIGSATAQAARDAGLNVVAVGEADARAALELARRMGLPHLLHLAGRERAADPPGVSPVTAYGSDPLPLGRDAVAELETGWIALLHSPRAAARLAELVELHRVRRDRVALAALSPAVLAAAGGGWNRAEAATRPTDSVLVDLARDMALGRPD